MDTTITIVVCVGMIVLGATFCSVMRTLKPAPAKPPSPKKDRFDIMEDELIRLHDELSNYDTDDCPEWIGQEIARINAALAEK